MNKDPHQSVDEQVQQFIQICREHDLKVTHQRLEIYRTFLMSENHPSAEDIYIRIQTQLPTVSLDTVYRTLALFEEHGLINRVQSVSDKVRFDANTAPHHHFICMKCKRIIDFSWAEFDRLTLPEGVRSFGEIQDKKIELRGICCRCRKKLA